jgi:hypothetical protein
MLVSRQLKGSRSVLSNVDVPKNGLGEQVYDWTVVLNGLDLNLSLLFYLYATPVDDDGFEQRPVSTRRINITHSVNPGKLQACSINNDDFLSDIESG